MNAILLFGAALPGLPDTRSCSASECQWLIVAMMAFLVVLVGLLVMAVVFQIRNRLS
jgi:hypothetical protein